MKATFPVEFLSISDRITGTDKEGHSFDYRRVILIIQDDPVTFIIRNNSSSAKMIPRFIKANRLEKFEIVLDFVKARDKSYYFCNLVEFVEA